MNENLWWASQEDEIRTRHHPFCAWHPALLRDLQHPRWSPQLGDVWQSHWLAMGPPALRSQWAALSWHQLLDQVFARLWRVFLLTSRDHHGWKPWEPPTYLASRLSWSFPHLPPIAGCPRDWSEHTRSCRPSAWMPSISQPLPWLQASPLARRNPLSRWSAHQRGRQELYRGIFGIRLGRSANSWAAWQLEDDSGGRPWGCDERGLAQRIWSCKLRMNKGWQRTKSTWSTAGQPLIEWPYICISTTLPRKKT